MTLIADSIACQTDPILITGSNGFIGARVVGTLLDYGFSNLRCLVRPSSNLIALNKVIGAHQKVKLQVIEGNLLSREDCEKITGNISVIYHLAAGRGVKSYPDAYLNSVVATRNLLDATLRNKNLKRFVNVSSFSVYSNEKLGRENCLMKRAKLRASPC